MQNQNPFDVSSAMANMYAVSRPKVLYAKVAEHIRQHLGDSCCIHDILDVACGTGSMTRALKTIVPHVVGIDIAQNMLSVAKNIDKAQNIEYVFARAECLPFKKESFDIITIVNAFHWINEKEFLESANRVLRNDGWIIITDIRYATVLTMGYPSLVCDFAPTPGFNEWATKIFLKEYPLVSGSKPRTSFYDFTDDTNLFQLVVKDVLMEIIWLTIHQVISPEFISC